MGEPTEEPSESWPWRRAILGALVPFLAPRITRSGFTLLGLLRLIVTTVSVALVLLLVVIAFALPWASGEPVPPIAWGLIGVGILAGATGMAIVRRREMPCGDQEEVAGAYRTRAFVGIAVAEAPALLAFVAAFIAEQGWLYLVGLAAGAVTLAMVAPTEGDLDRKEAELRAQGCPQSLREALSQHAEPAVGARPRSTRRPLGWWNGRGRGNDSGQEAQ